MPNNYFKTTLRSMIESPLSSFINVFVLAVAIGVCMVVYAFIDFDLRIDRFHKHEDEFFLSTYRVNREESEECNGNALTPLGDLLLESEATIKKQYSVQNCKIIQI